MKLAVIGAHNRGRISLLAHHPERGFSVVAVCGSSPDGLEVYRETIGAPVPFTADYRDIVGNPSIDAVFVCSPDHLHAEHACAALRAGKHVFLEKPMAVSIADCDRILKVHAESSARLYVGHNMRFFPSVQIMHQLITEGRIGRVEAIWCRHFVSYGGDAYFKDWHSERAYSHGLLLQKGAHDIDIIHHLGGAYTRRVVGMGKLSVYDKISDRRQADEPGRTHSEPPTWPPLSHVGLSPIVDIEDHSMLLLQLANGVQASYMQCHYSPDAHRNYTIIGTEGRIENYGDISRPGQPATVHLWNQRVSHQAAGHEVRTVPQLEGHHGGADRLMIEDFLSFLTNGTTLGASPQDARQAVAAGYLGTNSLREGSVPYDVP
ncbi:predicted dehydrogenase [Terrimicrobium sacchariphilum]|uniref:Predicted dehydrogenase n=1 Tax=Terrimicrobium sacchariphilum TaxID=690879 RepID=A0A146G473_TERSA|nr:Gfo/Idh/MocA family oxidoreductase [Terrimicrobium sacchariphilum]GAT31834.1 predicted dehydrogenase [Terrimicrobium sacchariphilum]